MDSSIYLLAFFMAICYNALMEDIKKLQNVIQSLSPDSYKEFCKWFEDYDTEKWDLQLEEDVHAGRLDELATKALKDLKKGTCTEL